MADLGEIVRLAERALGPAGAAPEPLPGGITNHNYRVRFGARDCVLRVTGADTALLGIDRDAERTAGEAAARLGIGPAVLDSGPDYMVTEYLDAVPVPAARLRADPGAAAAVLGTFHASGLSLANRFWVPELLEQYAAIVAFRGRALPDDYGVARSVAHHVAAVLPLRDPVPCHNDLLAANVLGVGEDPGRVMLVDWEYAGMGHRLFDLGNLAVNNEFDAAAETRLLEAYFGEPPSPGRRAALGLMRLMSDAREAAWGVVQATVSELEFDFAGYARRHFARLRAAADSPQFTEWLRGART